MRFTRNNLGVVYTGVSHFFLGWGARLEMEFKRFFTCQARAIPLSYIKGPKNQPLRALKHFLISFMTMGSSVLNMQGKNQWGKINIFHSLILLPFRGIVPFYTFGSPHTEFCQHLKHLWNISGQSFSPEETDISPQGKWACVLRLPLHFWEASAPNGSNCFWLLPFHLAPLLSAD